MNKIKVLTVVKEDDLKYDIKSRLSHEDIAFAGFSKPGPAALEKIRSVMPDAVLIAMDQDTDGFFEMAERIYITLPGCTVILLCKEVSLSTVERAMRAGVRKVLDIRCDREILLETIRSGFIMERARIQNSGGKITRSQPKIITVFGSKGGIGKTTIAANLAIALSHKGKKVAAIDLDLPFGDLNLFFDLQPKDTIAELVQEKQNLDIDTIKSYMMLHSSGVSVLCAPKSPELAEIISAEHIERITNTVRPYFDYTIIDTSPDFSDPVIAAVENSDQVLLVLTLDISTLRNAKISLDVFESLQQKDKVSLLVNRNAPSLISIKDAQRILNMPVKYKLSSDWKSAIASLNKGVPLILDAPRSMVGHELTQLGGLIMQQLETKA